MKTNQSQSFTVESCFHYAQGERYNNGRGVHAHHSTIESAHNHFDAIINSEPRYAVTITDNQTAAVIRKHGNMAEAKSSSTRAYFAMRNETPAGPSRVVAHLPAFVNPVCLQAVYASTPAGVEIVGNGTIPNPLAVKLSPVYQHAPELAKVLHELIEFSEPILQNHGFGYMGKFQAARAILAKVQS